jgi:hypothetical protein
VFQLYKEILRHPELGYRADGIYTYNSKSKSTLVPHLGKFIDMDESALKKYDRIFFF